MQREGLTFCHSFASPVPVLAEGLQGNLLIGRLMGAKIHMCAASEYYQLGGDLPAADALNQKIADHLRAQGHRPYVIPVGGTTPVGTWGYLQAVQDEVHSAWDVSLLHRAQLKPAMLGDAFWGLHR